MEINLVDAKSNLSEIIKVLNVSHGTVAEVFNFSKDNNPTNNAFIDEDTLCKQLNSGIDLFAMTLNKKIIGCIAIEKSKRQADTYYIEKVSVIPSQRNKGCGIELMDFATDKIKKLGAKSVAIALIDSNTKLKSWYSSQGFIETGIKDFEHLPFLVCFMSKQL